MLVYTKLDKTILKDLTFEYSLQEPKLKSDSSFIFISDDIKLCNKMYSLYTCVKVIFLDLRNANEDLEYYFIRCLKVSEINLYVNFKHVVTRRTYAIKGKRGVRYFPYHLYLRGWTFTHDLSNKIDYYIHIHDGSFTPNYNVKSFLTTTCDNLTDFTNKHNLYKQVPKYMAKQFTLFDYDVQYPVILKPEGKRVFGGFGIIVVNNKDEYVKAKLEIEKNHALKYEAYEYIVNPLLFEGKKFHLRVYMIVSSWRCELFPFYRLLHAFLPYKNEDFSNTKIHDTHVKSTKDNYFFPKHLFSWKANEQIKTLFDELILLMKPRPYGESNFSYEVLAMDIMIREDHTIVLLEINDKPGLNLVDKNKDYWYQEKFANLELSFVKDVFELTLCEFKDITKDEIKSLSSFTSNDFMKSVGEGKPWDEEKINVLKEQDSEDAKLGIYLDREYCQWYMKFAFQVVGYIALRPLKGEEGKQIRIFTYPSGQGFGKLALIELLRIYKGVLWAVVKHDNVASNLLFKAWPYDERMYVGHKHKFYKYDNRYTLATNVTSGLDILKKYYRRLPISENPDFVIHDGKQKVNLNLKSKNLIITNNIEHEALLAICCFNLERAITFINLPVSKVPIYSTYTTCGTNGLKRYYFHSLFRSWKLSSNGYFVHREAGCKNFNPCFMKNQVEGIDEFINKDYLYEHMSDFMPATYDPKDVDLLDFKNKVYLVKPVGFGAFSGASIRVVETKEEMLRAISDIRQKRKDWRISIQEYIMDPLLYNGRKFHVRVHVIVSCWGSFLFPYHEILTAKLPYVNGDFKNKLIHDSHGASTDTDIYMSYNMQGYDGIQKIFETLRDKIQPIPYSESVFGYETLGLDIMFTEHKTYLLEINNKVGQDAVSEDYYKTRMEWEKKYVEWEYQCIKDILL